MRSRTARAKAGNQRMKFPRVKRYLSVSSESVKSSSFMGVQTVRLNGCKMTCSGRKVYTHPVMIKKTPTPPIHLEECWVTIPLL